MPLDIAEWLEREDELRFRAGELYLGSRRFRALVLDAHFTCMQQRAGELRLPLEKLVPPVQALSVLCLPAPEPLRPIQRDQGTIRYVSKQRVNHYTCLPGTFEEFLKSLPAKARHELTRKVRKCEANCCGRVKVREYRRPEEVEEFQRLAAPVSERTYQGRLLQEGIPAGEAFRHELLVHAQAGTLRAYLLFLNDRPAAYGLCFVCGEVLVYYRTGYDPELSALSPGMVLLYHMARCACAEGRFKMLDYGPSDYAWKRDFANGCVRCAAVHYFRPTLWNALTVAAHYAFDRAIGWVHDLSQALGLKKGVKRLVRWLKP